MGLRRIALSFLLLAFCSVSIIVILRTITLSAYQSKISECKKSDFDFIEASGEVLERFRTALRFKTVSKSRNEYNRDELDKLQQFLRSAYPVIFSSPLVQVDVVANYSLLFSVKGSNPDLMPYMLMAHLDVVPAEPSKWDVPPFSADIVDGFIYARGTIDFKHGVMGILEALNFFLKQGSQPNRGFYVAFGHDEEVSGLDGAAAISDLLVDRGVRNLEFILDEGLTIVNGVIPGMKGPVGLIGSSEKGYVSVELSVEGEPGHSSMPPRESTIGILANAIAKLERYPQPDMLGYGPEKDTFEHLASRMNLPYRVVMSNLWLFKPVVSWVMSQKPSTNAVIRTVTAVTMFNAGIKENVNAPSARAVVNHRIHPSQTVQQVLDYDRYIINDERVKLSILTKCEPHPISPSGDEDFGYQTVKTSIRQVWDDLPVAPGTMIGATDTRHYLEFTKNVYRFSPSVMFPNDLKRFHGDNERISIQNYEQAINFYYHVIKNSEKEFVEGPHKHGNEL